MPNPTLSKSEFFQEVQRTLFLYLIGFLGLKKGGDYVLWRYWFRKYRTDTEEDTNNDSTTGDKESETQKDGSMDTEIEGTAESNRTEK